MSGGQGNLLQDSLVVQNSPQSLLGYIYAKCEHSGHQDSV